MGYVLSWVVTATTEGENMSETLYRCCDCGRFIEAYDAGIIPGAIGHGYVACVGCEEESYGRGGKAAELLWLRGLWSLPAHIDPARPTNPAEGMSEWLIDPESIPEVYPDPVQESTRRPWYFWPAAILSLIGYLIMGE
jgi:hypothetical protein